MKFIKKINIPKFPKEIIILNLLNSIGLNNKFLNKKNSNVLGPNLKKLFFLYKLITLNKRLTVIEFGSGWSTLVLSLAMDANLKKYKDKAKNLKSDKFEIFSLDNSKKFLNISKKRVTIFKSKHHCKMNFLYSPVKMSQFENRICTEYTKLPTCNPDFIYLDGPDQFNIVNKVNNFSSANKDLIPMSADILKFEFYLMPGTIILVDGRAGNVEFLKKNFKRMWIYKFIKEVDQHIFFLDEPSWGEKNLKLLKFYKN